ncbi:hypothetical protein pb186bvf_002973 [Paramecium bursaria]
MQCSIESHDGQKIKYICLQQNCNQDRTGCADCFLENHQLHSRMQIENFEQEIRKKVEQMNIQLKSIEQFDVDEQIIDCQRQVHKKLESYRQTLKSQFQRESTFDVTNKMQDDIKAIENHIDEKDYESAVQLFQDLKSSEPSKQDFDMKNIFIKKRQKLVDKMKSILEFVDKQLDDSHETPDKSLKDVSKLHLSGSSTHSPPFKLIEAARKQVPRITMKKKP